ncbi:MAG: bacillithiol system redox-active protein YtxJ [Melioribacteraceae bacterium]|nr:bacillithiol system redox-active protein YtxJ [Melioribacteraceae bacterium]MCF8357033.1 bacillithiol system redox-active protein YtxJ [Melioribacteraceae bacterium]MCF8393951.1 bacillithiol system redox-active protein YtxJ [Melioribacteraceae bacterium]MCF8419024.1 bacillithiol system redox-active protein YtxJ [Melioribacteraceae bacterium]
MSKEFTELTDVQQFEDFLQNNSTKQIIIFKFSPVCAISTIAQKKFERWYNEIDPAFNLIAVRVNVIGSRQLSNYLSEKYLVIHQSPQVIWIDELGKARWHESHFEITKRTLNSQLESYETN